MKGKIDWDVILNYLDGTASPDDKKIIEQWVQQDAKNQDQLNQLKTIWRIPGTSLPKPDVETALSTVAKRAGIPIDTGEKKDTSILNFKPTTKKRSVPIYLLKAAAIILIILSASYFLVDNGSIISMNELVVATGTQETITLSDGTQVILDAGSAFQYPETFDQQKREVRLQGEGYFQVTPDADKPFVVRAHNAVITVLGTTFNVRAWRQHKKTIVTVENGRISFRPERTPDKPTGVILDQGQMSIMNEDNIPSSPQTVDVQKHIAWLKREMYFSGAPLQEVLDQLERWYNVKFILPAPGYASHRITVFIENKPIAEIVDMIALVNNFKFMQDGNKIIFSEISE